MHKYALHVGYIYSKVDGDYHYVGVGQLAKLYGVPLDRCIVVDRERPETYQGRDLSQHIHLHVRYDGKYECQK